jgi:hypothetical protein
MMVHDGEQSLKTKLSMLDIYEEGSQHCSTISSYLTPQGKRRLLEEDQGIFGRSRQGRWKWEEEGVTVT